MNKLAELRAMMAEAELAAFILPRGDRYLGEYVAPRDELLAWLSGFTGSAGYAVVTADEAWLMTDGRYQTQAPEEVDLTQWQIGHSGEIKLAEWLAEKLPDGGLVGYDPQLHSAAWLKTLSEKLNGLYLIALGQNPVATIWQDRPAPPPEKFTELQKVEYSGATHSEKINQIIKPLQAANCRALIINDPTQIAWLLNLRGRDVPHTPVAQCQAILYADGTVDVFINPASSVAAHQYLWGIGVKVHDEHALADALAQFTADDFVWLDMGSTSAWHLQHLEAQLYEKTSPIIAARAIKNSVEIAGARNAHIRDGKILTEFYQWIKAEAQKGILSELSINEELIKRRSTDKLYVEESFPAIIGWQAHGAVIHYRANEKTSATIKGDGLLLIDCGAQYRDGTTDITRTLGIGDVTEFQRECYTSVLQGHIAIARARFPTGTTGHQLDALARYALWQAGLNYDHGTGHGVGSFLSVHEGPQSISTRMSDVALAPGMILSNEPGYYKRGEFGIRLENLVLVQPDPDHSGFLSFETLTRAPFDEAMIVQEMLTEAEKQWLQNYQQLSC